MTPFKQNSSFVVFIMADGTEQNFCHKTNLKKVYKLYLSLLSKVIKLISEYSL